MLKDGVSGWLYSFGLVLGDQVRGDFNTFSLGLSLNMGSELGILIPLGLSFNMGSDLGISKPLGLSLKKGSELGILIPLGLSLKMGSESGTFSSFRLMYEARSFNHTSWFSGKRSCDWLTIDSNSVCSSWHKNKSDPVARVCNASPLYMCNVMYLHTCWLCSWSYTHTLLGTKMAALTVVFLRPSIVIFLRNKMKNLMKNCKAFFFISHSYWYGLSGRLIVISDSDQITRFLSKKTQPLWTPSAIDPPCFLLVL